MSLSPIDENAMKRAIEMVRQRDKASRDQIDLMLRNDPWPEVGTFASYSCQSDTLRLKPWQTAPLWVGDLGAALRKKVRRSARRPRSC